MSDVLDKIIRVVLDHSFTTQPGLRPGVDSKVKLALRKIIFDCAALERELTGTDGVPGATGDFPKGQLDEEDEGGLNIGVAREENGKVVVHFGKPIAWLAMDPEETVQFATVLMANANAKLKVKYPDELFEKIVDTVSGEHMGSYEFFRDRAIGKVKALLNAGD